MKWEGWMPVAVSIAVIILVAVVQRYSRTLAAITATMDEHTKGAPQHDDITLIVAKVGPRP